MTEVLNRPESQKEDIPDTDRFDLPEQVPVTRSSGDIEDDISIQKAVDNREISPTGSNIVRVAARINSILERRAINKAHSEALKEYKDRDYNDYIDHLESVTDSVDTTPAAKASARMSLDREYLKTDAKEAFDTAKGKVGKFGRSALAHLKGAGAKIETLKQNREADKIHKEALVENHKRDTQHEKALKINEKLDRIRARKDAALARKQARREKWSGFKAGLKEYGGYVKEGLAETKGAVKDKFTNTKERAKNKARVYRSAGRQALATYRDAIEAHKSN